jgi:hypothetical protein
MFDTQPLYEEYLIADLDGACSRDDPKGAFDARPTVRS